MHANLLRTLALVAALTTVPAVAADEPTSPSADADTAPAAGPCDVFWYTLDPVGYGINLDCLPIPVPELPLAP